jgi:hypothetical protein
MMQLILMKFIDELDKCVPWMSYHQIGVYSYCYKGEGQKRVVKSNTNTVIYTVVVS